MSGTKSKATALSFMPRYWLKLRRTLEIQHDLGGTGSSPGCGADSSLPPTLRGSPYLSRFTSAGLSALATSSRQRRTQQPRRLSEHWGACSYDYCGKREQLDGEAVIIDAASSQKPSIVVVRVDRYPWGKVPNSTRLHSNTALRRY